MLCKKKTIPQNFFHAYRPFIVFTPIFLYVQRKISYGNPWTPVFLGSQQCIPHHRASNTKFFKKFIPSLPLGDHPTHSALWLPYGSSIGRRSSSLVRFTYNEDNNVLMTGTGSVSQMRGSVERPSACKIPRWRPKALGPVGDRKYQKKGLQ